MSTDPEQRVRHPAKFSRSILKKLDELVPSGLWLDPMAGLGLIHRLERNDRCFVGVEIEKPWADQEDRTIHGDAFVVLQQWVEDGTRFDGIVTSPTYGNRFADKHNAKDDSRRHSYTHDLRAMTGNSGYVLEENNSGGMYFWTEEYKQFHLALWKLCCDVTRPGGKAFINVKNFMRTPRGKPQRVEQVVGWHIKALVATGWAAPKLTPVKTPGMRDGANSEARVEAEQIIEVRKPA